MNEILFAQDSSVSMPLWMQVSGGVVSLGFAVWYAWFTTTKTIPELNDKHEKTISILVGEFRTEAKEQRAAEQQRATVSAELARSGHAAMSQVVTAVQELKVAIENHHAKAQ